MGPHWNSAGGLLGPKWEFRRAVFCHPYRGFALSSEKAAFQRTFKIQRNSHDLQNAQKCQKTNLSENQMPILAQHRSQKGLRNRSKINENFDAFLDRKITFCTTLWQFWPKIGVRFFIFLDLFLTHVFDTHFHLDAYFHLFQDLFLRPFLRIFFVRRLRAPPKIFLVASGPPLEVGILRFAEAKTPFSHVWQGRC